MYKESQHGHRNRAAIAEPDRFLPRTQGMVTEYCRPVSIFLRLRLSFLLAASNLCSSSPPGRDIVCGRVVGFMIYDSSLTHYIFHARVSAETA